MKQRTPEEELELYRRMHVSAVERHIDLAVSVLRLAGNGHWVELVEYAHAHLTGGDWDPESELLLVGAKHAAMQAEGRQMEGQMELLGEEAQ